MNGDLDPVVWFIISTAGKDPSKSTPLALFGVGSNHDATFASSEFWLSDSLLKYCGYGLQRIYDRQKQGAVLLRRRGALRSHICQDEEAKSKKKESSNIVQEVINARPPLVLTSQGRVQTLPSRFNDLVLDNWKKENSKATTNKTLFFFSMERILARYERCSYAESLANPTANPTDQESAGSWSLEYAKLKARIEFLEKSKRERMRPQERTEKIEDAPAAQPPPGPPTL
nr:histone-lysine N-methyltransferase ATX4-like [Ipomoea batatas]